MKKLGLGVIAGLAVLLAGSTASAQYPPGGATLVLTPSTVAPGGSFNATFFGCTLGETVSFAVVVAGGDSDQGSCTGPAGARFVSATTGPSATVTMTAPTAPGTYTVTATGLTSGATASATLTVVAAPAAPGGGLPTTGSDSEPIMQIGIGLLAVGTGLAFVANKRRHRTTAA
jgi:LPXTG-motif cell wall-anchored protein